MDQLLSPTFGGISGIAFPFMSLLRMTQLHLSCDVIQCQCRAQGKNCRTEICGCHKQHLGCTSFCNCLGDESCCNPYTTQEDAQPGNEEDAILMQIWWVLRKNILKGKEWRL